MEKQPTMHGQELLTADEYDEGEQMEKYIGMNKRVNHILFCTR